MAQKISRAVDARNDADLVVVARTDAIAASGLEDAMERATAYIEAGADMTFVEAPRTLEQMSQIPVRLRVPQVINIVSGGLTPMVGMEELEKMGFCMVLYANAALQVSITAMQKVLGYLKTQGSLEGVSAYFSGFEDRQRIVSKHHFDGLERKYRLPD
jgi:2-methylisocitrate lyase-like PEP mutase family enzyme